MDMGSRRTKMQIAAFTVVLVALLLGPIAPAWTSPLQRPQRQTVPMTPPATWTPAPIPGQGEPTPDPKPTALPTSRPQDSDQSSGGDGKLGGTPKDAEPTSEPSMAVPWFGLATDQAYVEPDMTVVLTARLANVGNAPLEPALVQVSVPGNLLVVSADATVGSVYDIVGQTLAWQVGGLGPNQEALLLVTCKTPDAMWPGTLMTVQGTVFLQGPTALEDSIELLAPAAILPQAGSL